VKIKIHLKTDINRNALVVQLATMLNKTGSSCPHEIYNTIPS